MNFAERFKNEPTFRIFVIVGGIVSVILIFFIFSLFSGGKKKTPPPCFNATLTIWAPFPEEIIWGYLKDYEKYCVRFNYRRKSFAELKSVLPRIMVQNEIPDIVFTSREDLIEYPQLFKKASTATIAATKPTLTKTAVKWFEPWLGVPLFVDSLISVYDPDILVSTGFPEPPETFSQLQSYIEKARIVDESKNLIFAPFSLGDIKSPRAGEILLAISALNQPDLRQQNIAEEFSKSVKFYLSFANPQNENYSYNPNWNNSLEIFLQKKVGGFISFYDDISEMQKINPRLKFTLGPMLRNDDSPRKANFTKIYYFAPLKTKNAEVAWKFTTWFYKYKLEKFSKEVNKIPANPQLKEKLDEDENLVLSEALVGETFDFVNINKLNENIDKILLAWLKSEFDGQRIFSVLKNELFPIER